MRRTSLTVVFLCLAFLFLTAMGGKGGGFERAPRVDKNFAVTVTDGSGNKINGEKFSWEGRIHFAGYMGMAQVVVPFDKVKELTVGEKKGLPRMTERRAGMSDSFRGSLRHR